MVKDYLLVRFGSRWEVEVDRRYISRKDILDRYEDFKKDCIDNDYEYIIDEFGMCEEVGDGIILAAEEAIKRNASLLVIPSSGGARMQEGIFSLMQLPRTIIAIEKIKTAKLPYIVLLTNPTMGGVTASFSMLGDIHIAEPNALIGFAGRRVIEETVREKLPENFQKAEYLREHGMVDMVVPRSEQRETIINI